MALPAFRPAGATPEIIAAFAVFAGLFHPAHHRLAAFFADLACALGKGLEFLLQAGMSLTDHGVVVGFACGDVIQRLFHHAGKFILHEAEIAA